MIGRWEAFLYRVRRWLSREEWLVRLLGLPRPQAPAVVPGLVLIQIDGLSRPQLERALARGRMPFLRRLLRREGYRLHSMYSGLPSTTPAVQAEFFYGIKAAVPAFGFRRRETGRIVRMFEPDPAARVEELLEREGKQQLLEGGSAYCNIYSGGAAEPHFCAAKMGWGELRKGKWTVWAAIALWSLPALLRIGWLSLLELGVAVSDFIRGFPHDPRNLVQELKFLVKRIVVDVILQELMTIGAATDAARGLPVIEVNFLAYDEHAHRRGPESAFAHWSLRSVDRAIRRIWRAAHNSRWRDYDVWVYSDHGQEASVPYPVKHGRTVEEAVAEVFGREVRRNTRRGVPPHRGMDRARWLFRPRSAAAEAETAAEKTEDEVVEVAAMGPVGHIYPRDELNDAECERLAEALVRQAQIPMVLVATGAGRVRVCMSAGGEERGRRGDGTTERHGDTEAGRRPENNDEPGSGQTGYSWRELPDEAAEVLGADHPFLDVVAADLVELCRHPEAGRIVFCGWAPGESPVTFPIENGAHGGPGPEETHAFLLLPSDAPIPEGDPIRPLALRTAALDRRGLGRRAERSVQEIRLATRDTLVLMTYNVHSCIGMDGRVSTRRIARVIAQCDPDIVALQELDLGRQRTGQRDQAREIARELEMEFHFHPAMIVEEEHYGDAILSRHPMRLIRAAELPGHVPGRSEPRGALWVEVEVGALRLQVITTHLGLWPGERVRQVDALLGPEWLGHPDCREPAVLCGDFNAMPGSRAYSLLQEQLRDAQAGLANHRPQRTFFGRWPVCRIDHVFLKGKHEVVRAEVVRTELARRASDHLPLVIDLRF